MVWLNKGDEGAEGILKRALRAPFRTIVKNAKQEDGYVYKNLLEKHENVWEGWDLYNEEIVNMYSIGVFDPLEVAEQAVLNSVSVAALLMTAECAIV